eukprot:SAG31_NODE_9856_length_1220_cov_0.967886_2_plen_318_part_01
MSLQKMAGVTGEIGHCNCNMAGNCLNMSMCAYTTGVDEFTVIAWNPEGQNVSAWLSIPVSGAAYTVTDLSTKATLASQATLIDARTKSLPLLYINAHGMDAESKASAESAHANKATHTLRFQASLPPVGYSTFSVKKVSKDLSATAVATTAAPTTVTNGVYELTLNHAAGTVETVKNLASGVETPLNVSWGYYVASEGGCTIEPSGNKSCSPQASGAYMFRPAEQFTHRPDNNSQPTLSVTTGPLVTEVKQVFADWATHTIRLTKGSPFIEVEWTAGPIPMTGHKGQQGKELVLKFSSGLESKGTFYTDSNGREMLKR